MTSILTKGVPKIVREIRNFRLPLIITAFVFTVFSFWIWRISQDGDHRILEKESYRAAEFTKVLVAGLLPIHQKGGWNDKEIEKGLTDILDASSYGFLVLARENKPVFRIGNVPEELNFPYKEGGYLLDDVFVFGHKFRLPEQKEKKTFWRRLFEGEQAGTTIPAGEQFLILGKKVRKDDRFFKALHHFFIPPAIVFLLLLVSSAAWITTIRTRLLSEQLKTERTRSAHLEELALAAAGLAHETKNPLGIISGLAQQIARDPQLSEKNREMIETIIDEVDTSSSRLGNFMTFAKKREIETVSFDFRELIEKIFRILQPEFESAGMTLEMECPPQLIDADEDMLQQILVNLLLNSLQASSPGSAITIRTKPHGDVGSIIVEDHGCGIPKELLPDIFKPYVTGRSSGHGLGLAIVKRFSEDHGWTVQAESEPGQGTIVKISGIVLSGKRGRQI